MMVRKVDPHLLASCADGIGEAHALDPKAFDANFVEAMAGVVMAKVRGDTDLALAILKRISALIVCMGSDPAIVAQFAGSGAAREIPRPLTHAAAVTPLRINGPFDVSKIRNAALRAVEPRGTA